MPGRSLIATRTTANVTNSGERGALLGRLLERYGAALRSQSRRHSATGADAEEALQDACVQFLLHFEGEGDLLHALPWMQLVVKRRAWEIGRRGRSEANRRRGISEEDQVQLPSVRRRPLETLEALAERDRELAMLAELKRDERVALILLGLGYSYREIAKKCGWTPTKVNRCINEGRAAVRKRKGGENASPDA